MMSNVSLSPADPVPESAPSAGSGSALRFFGTDGIRGRAGEHPLTAEMALRIGAAAADLFRGRGGGYPGEWPTVVIGKDTRQSGDMLECAVAAGISSRGIDVRLAGVVPTPAVATLVRETGALFGVVISASHNPFEDNGIKFFGPDGRKLEDAEEVALEARLSNPSEREKPDAAGAGDVASPPPGLGRCAPLEDAADRYVERVRASVSEEGKFLSGVKIALDNANGASCATSEALLRSLGAEVVSFHSRPSGLNINADCGCTHPEAIARAVRESGADLGISHDGDADRVLLCDELGVALDGDEFMAVVAVDLLEREALAGNRMVATVMSNAGLDEAVERAGGGVVRSGVGDRKVVGEMRRIGANFGGEQSGHFVFLDHSTTGDGILAALQFLRVARRKNQPLSELRRVMEKVPQVLRNVRVAERRPIDQLGAAGKLAAEIESDLGRGGRLLLRYSGTEPLLRILVEGREEEWIAAKAEELARAVEEEIGEVEE